MNMKQIAIWIAAAVALYLIALLALLPAHYAIDKIAPQLGVQPGGEWSIGHIEGTIWSGEIGNINHQNRAVGKLAWELHPLSLLIGNLALSWSLNSQGGALQGEAVVNSAGDIGMEDLKGEIPVEELTALLPFVPFAVNGMVTLDLSELELKDRKPALIRGNIHWNRAEIVAMQSLDFGDVTVSFDTEEESGEIAAQINNQRGTLAVNATATVKSSGEYQLAGEIAARTKADKALLNNFMMLGRPDQSGRLRFKRSGKL